MPDSTKSGVEMGDEPSKPGESLPAQEDAVFGVITEDGPNYRNVSSKVSLNYAQTLTDCLLGWYAGRDGTHDQDSVRSWCSFHSSGV